MFLRSSDAQWLIGAVGSTGPLFTAASGSPRDSLNFQTLPLTMTFCFDFVRLVHLQCNALVVACRSLTLWKFEGQDNVSPGIAIERRSIWICPTLNQTIPHASKENPLSCSTSLNLSWRGRNRSIAIDMKPITMGTRVPHKVAAEVSKIGNL